MLGNFYKSLKSDESKKRVPASVVRELNKDLPKGYKYTYNSRLGQLIISPDSKVKKHRINVNFSLDSFKDLPEWAKKNFNTLIDYLYRTQSSIKVERVAFTDGEKNFDFIDAFNDPLEDTNKKTFVNRDSLELRADSFPKPAPWIVELEDGREFTIMMGRVPYDSPDHVRFENYNYKALKLSWVLPDHYSQEDPGVMQITVTPHNAETVREAVESLEIFKGYANGTIKIQDTTLRKKSSPEQVDPKQLDGMILFWENLKKLENILKVQFIPNAEFPEEDILFYNELVNSFIDNKPSEYFAPYKSITVNNNAVDNDKFQEILKNKVVVAFAYTTKPADATLLGAKFSLCSAVLFKDIIFDRVEPSDKDDKSVVYIKSATEGEKWKMYKVYTKTSEEASSRADELYHKYLKKE